MQRDAAVEAAIGIHLSGPLPWKERPDPVFGQAWQAVDPSVGIFLTDPSGRTILSAALADPVSIGPPLDQPGLLSQAEAVAARFAPVKSLELYQSGTMDRGYEKVFTAEWRERRGQAWLPMSVSVSLVNDGQLSDLFYNPITVGQVETTPSIDAHRAADIATKSVGSASSLARAPELDVIGPPSRPPALVWVVSLLVGAQPEVPTLEDIPVNALSGLLYH